MLAAVGISTAITAAAMATMVVILVAAVAPGCCPLHFTRHRLRALPGDTQRRCEKLETRTNQAHRPFSRSSFCNPLSNTRPSISFSIQYRRGADGPTSQDEPSNPRLGRVATKSRLKLLSNKQKGGGFLVGLKAFFFGGEGGDSALRPKNAQARLRFDPFLSNHSSHSQFSANFQLARGDP